jgi:hypothetical protein
MLGIVYREAADHEKQWNGHSCAGPRKASQPLYSSGMGKAICYAEMEERHTGCGETATCVDP